MNRVHYAIWPPFRPLLSLLLHVSDFSEGVTGLAARLKGVRNVQSTWIAVRKTSGLRKLD